jgi:hypothetical protein
MDLHIIPECYIDTKLIKVLVPPTTRYNHQKGVNTVANEMQENNGRRGKFFDQFAVGIIDRDKRNLGYAEQFDLVFQLEGNIQLFKHQTKHHYLIFICPAMEKWILNVADEASINLSDFGLPTDLKNLTNITKTAKSEDNDPNSEKFVKLFKELKAKQPKAIKLLMFWIEYLKEQNYNANKDYLIKLSSEM